MKKKIKEKCSSIYSIREFLLGIKNWKQNEKIVLLVSAFLLLLMSRNK